MAICFAPLSTSFAGSGCQLKAREVLWCFPRPKPKGNIFTCKPIAISPFVPSTVMTLEAAAVVLIWSLVPVTDNFRPKHMD
ncbi:hypothetical protein ACFX2C_022129 [Malus domestica]